MSNKWHDAHKNDVAYLERHRIYNKKRHDRLKSNSEYVDKRRLGSIARYHALIGDLEYKKSRREDGWKSSGITNKDGSRFVHIDYDRAYQIQSGRCKLCLKHSSELSRPLCVDHNHKTNKFRGLLCIACNVAIGQYERIKTKAEEYLK